MDIFLKTLAGTLIVAVIGLIISKQSKDFSLIISLLGCCLVIIASVFYLKPILSFVDKLKGIGDLDYELTETIFKAVGISILAEITSLICSDSGNASLSRTINILSSATIIWLSLPMFTKLLDLIDNILGAL